MLSYGALYEANRLVIERRTLRLRGWRRSLNGFKIALLADMHIRDEYSMELDKRAVAAALDANPDMVVLAGDIVGYWKPESQDLLAEALEPLLLMDGNAVAIPGNREYWSGDPERLRPVLDSLNIRLLRNHENRDNLQVRRSKATRP